jgi:hypothetical protein
MHVSLTIEKFHAILNSSDQEQLLFFESLRALQKTTRLEVVSTLSQPRGSWFGWDLPDIVLSSPNT